MDDSRVALVYTERGPVTGEEDCWAKKLGSGYRISTHLVLTARHVVAQAETVTVWLGGGSEEWPARAVWEHPGYDVALLRLLDGPADKVDPVRFGKIDRRRTAEVPFSAAGYPLATADKESRWCLTVTGRIRANSRTDLAGALVLLDDAPEPTAFGTTPWAGMSGAGLFAGRPGPRDGSDTRSDPLVAVFRQHRVAAGTTSAEVVLIGEIADPGWSEALATDQVPFRTVPVLAENWNPTPSAIMLHHERLDQLARHRSAVRAHRVRYVAATSPDAPTPKSVLAELDEMVARGGSLRGVLVTGIPGVGKSRFVLETAKQAAEAGWLPLHVEGSSSGAAVTRALEHLLGRGRVLLVLDNVAELAGLTPAEVSTWLRAADDRDTELAVLAAARADWWAQTDRVSPQYLWPWKPTSIVTDARQLDDLTELAVKHAAPLAVRLGRRHLEKLCAAALPAVIVMLAEYCNQEVRSGKTLHQIVRLDSDTTAQWVSAIVGHLGLTPVTAPGAGEPYRVDLRLVATALLVTAVPARRADLVEAVEALDRSSSRSWTVAKLIDDLLLMGLLDESGDEVLPVHDTVADHLLDRALRDQSDDASASALEVLLGVGLERPQLLTGLLRAFGRSADALPNPSAAAARVDTIRDWSRTRVGALGTALAQERSGAALQAMLSSELWKGVLRENDRALIDPTLTAGGTDGPLDDSVILALTKLDTPYTREVEAGWRRSGRQAEGYAQMVNRRLADPALDASEWRRVVDEAIDWLAVHRRQLAASWILERLLSPRDGGLPTTDPRLAGVITDALDWNRDFAAESDFLAAACLRHPSIVDDDLERLVEDCVDSIGANRPEDASFLLAGLVKRAPDLRAESRSLVARAALSWIEGNQASPVAPYVLEQVLRRLGERESFDRATEVSLRWLETHGMEASAGRVLRPLLVLVVKGGWGAGLREDEIKDALRCHTVNWLERSGHPADDRYEVIGKLLRSRLVADDADLLSAYSEEALAYYSEAPSPLVGRSLLQPLVRVASDEGTLWRRVRAATRRNILRWPLDEQTVYLITTWLERPDLTSGDHAWLLTAADAWLGTRRRDRAGLKLLARCVNHRLSDADSRRRFGREAVRWVGPEALEDRQHFDAPRHGLTRAMELGMAGAPEWQAYVAAMSGVLADPAADRRVVGETVKIMVRHGEELSPEIRDGFFTAVLGRVGRRKAQLDDQSHLRLLLGRAELPEELRIKASELGLEMIGPDRRPVQGRPVLLEDLLLRGSFPTVESFGRLVELAVDSLRRLGPVTLGVPALRALGEFLLRSGVDAEPKAAAVRSWLRLFKPFEEVGSVGAPEDWTALEELAERLRRVQPNG